MDALVWAIEFGVFVVGMLAGVCLWEWAEEESGRDGESTGEQVR